MSIDDARLAIALRDRMIDEVDAERRNLEGCEMTEPMTEVDRAMIAYTNGVLVKWSNGHLLVEFARRLDAAESRLAQVRAEVLEEAAKICYAMADAWEQAFQESREPVDDLLGTQAARCGDAIRQKAKECP